MSSESKLIMDTIKMTGENASAMTHALKNVGNGNMGNGISRIGAYYESRGILEGTVIGLGIGALLYLGNKILKRISNSRKEGKAILEELEKGINEYENETSESQPFE